MSGPYDPPTKTNASGPCSGCGFYWDTSLPCPRCAGKAALSRLEEWLDYISNPKEDRQWVLDMRTILNDYKRAVRLEEVGRLLIGYKPRTTEFKDAIQGRR